MRKTMNMMVLAIVLALAMAAEALAFSGRTHESQLEGVFARIDGSAFHEAANQISSAMDNELLESFRQTIGKVPGNHRLIGHGWTLDGEIPRDVLKTLEEANPGRKADILQWWSGESKRLVEGMEKATGLPTKQAKALAGLQWDFHLLGDRMPGNTVVDVVLPPKAIAKNIDKNCEILFKALPEYAKAIGKSLRWAMQQGGADAEQAARLMEMLQKEIPFSEMLSRCWGRTLAKRGIQIVPRTARSVGTEAFLAKVGVASPKTFASKARQKAGQGKSATGKSGAATGGKTAKVARWGGRAVFVALPVAVEAGLFFYDEQKNKEARARGDQTDEETQCMTYVNTGKHAAALALGVGGAAGGGKVGAAIGTGIEPGVGTTAGGVIGGIVGGIVGCVIGEIGGAKAGEMLYVSKAQKGAEEGDPAALFFLGGYHYKRIQEGKDKHVKEAWAYLERVQVTTNGGFAKANVFLGEMAWNGIGQDENKAKAIALWRVAVALGDEDAMYLMARALLAGDGIEKDQKAGLEMMRESAARGCELAIDAYPEVVRECQKWSIIRWSVIGGVGVLGMVVLAVGWWKKRRQDSVDLMSGYAA